MPEVNVHVITYAARMRCDKCGAGEMLPTKGRSLLSMPAQYEHKCDSPACGHKATYRYLYPDLRQVAGTLEQPLPMVPNA